MPGMTSTNSGTIIDDSIDIENNAAGTLVLAAATAGHTSPLAAGVYDVWCTTDVFVKVGATADDVTATNGYLIRQNNSVTVRIRPQSRIGGLSVAGGTLTYHKVG